MAVSLLQKTALVTGGTRGIGLAIARGLADAGASVHICGRSEQGVEEAVAELQSVKSAGSVTGSRADVSRWEDVSSLFDRLRADWDKLDILVCNAGIGIFRPVAELEPEEWRRVIDLNLNGVYYCCHAALPMLRESGNGYVFNVSSLAGKNAFAGGAAYNASKFGVNGFTEAMMLDHRHENIRFTSIMPGSVNTNFGSVSGRPAKPGDWKIQPEDIAEVVLALLALPARTLVSSVEIRPAKPPR